MMIRKLLLGICYFSFFVVVGQELHFKVYNTNDGLSNNSVNDIINDTSGAIWVSTWDGLNVYDGNQFQVFKHNVNDSTSISGNETFNLVQDKDQNLWIETNKSISRYLGDKKFENFFFKKEIKNLELSIDNNPLVLFSDGSYQEYINKQFVPVSKDSVRKKQYGVYENILLAKYPTLIINDIYKNNDESIWFATRNNGLFILELEEGNLTIKNYKKDRDAIHSIPSNEVEVIHKDVFGGIWLGFKDGGLSLVQKTVEGVTTILPHPANFPHLPTETIRAITKDKSNRLWLGYYTKGIYRFSKKTDCFVRYDIPKAKKNPDWNRVRCLYTTSDGSVWAGTYAGIICIKNNDVRYFSAEDYALFPYNRNYTFFEDQEGKLWIGCWGGVAKMDIATQKFESFTNQKKLDAFQIRNLYVKGDELFIATREDGVLCFNHKEGTYENITEKDGLAGNSVFSIVYDAKNKNFWAASLGGISVIDEDKKVTKVFTEKEGLPSHMVYGLLAVDDDIWASTTKGITKVNTDEFVVQAINPDENWQSKEFSEGAYYKDTNTNTLYFGGINGLSYFKPDDLQVEDYLPRLSVAVDGYYKKNITKNYADNYLKIQIHPISFVKNVNNKVLYQLRGYDEDWQELRKQAVFYEDIPSGEYTLVVKNSLDYVKANTIRYYITIKKPFYLSKLFLALVSVLLLCGIIYFLYKKNRASIKYQQKLESEIEKRTQTIEQQKAELLSLHNNLKSNSFELDKFKTFVVEKFKQPLIVTLDTIAALKTTPDEKELVSAGIKEVMNKILEWNYLEDISKLGEFKKAFIATETIREVVKSYEQKFKEYDIEFIWSFQNTIEYIEIDLVRYRLLFQYFFYDILKYSHPNSSVTTNISFTEEHMLFNFVTNSNLLIDNIDNVQNYSPYYGAFLNLLQYLEGTINVDVVKGTLVCIDVATPIFLPDKTTVRRERNILVNIDDLPKDKKVFLVYAAATDFSMASCLLDSSEYHLVFERDIQVVSKLVRKTKRFDALVLYNVSFSSDLVSLLTFISKNAILPTIYISEKIDYSLQEKITEFDINEMIQLPANKSFILSRVSKLLANQITYKEALPEIDSTTFSSPNEKFVEEALRVIKENYHKAEFNIEFLVNKLGISRIKCYRMFKEVLEQSPSDVIIQYRMKRAYELLETGKLNISEVSFECGFNDPKYFSKAFKKYYGFPPKKIKK